MHIPKNNRSCIISKEVSSIFNNNGEITRIYKEGRHFEAEISTFVKLCVDGVEKCLQLCEENFYIEQKFVEYSNVLQTEYTSKNIADIKVLKTDFIVKDIIISKYKFLTNGYKSLTNGNLETICFKLGNGNVLKGGSIFINNRHVVTSENYCVETYFSENPIYVDINGNDYNIWDNYRERKLDKLFKNNDYCGLSTSSKIYFEDKEKKHEKDITICRRVSNNNQLNNDISELLDKFSQEKFLSNYIKKENECKLKKIEEIFAKKFESIDILKNSDKMLETILRTIEIYSNLSNQNPMLASFECDEKFNYSGGYGYVWARDMYYILKGIKNVEQEKWKKYYLDYSKFLINTQIRSNNWENGRWEQRYYINGNIAPSWGYQIDECAISIIILKECLNICDDDTLFRKISESIKLGLQFILRYVSEQINDYGYDLWENRKYENLDDLNIYSLSTIAIATEKIAINEIDKIDEIECINDLIDKSNIKEQILEKLKNKLYTRNKIVDISDFALNSFKLNKILVEKGYVDEKYLDIYFENILSTLKIESGYLRYLNDSYFDGRNPWSLSSLYALEYYIYKGNEDKISKILNEFLDLTYLGLIPEQKDDDGNTWAIPLFWAHGLFLEIVKNLEKRKGCGKIWKIEIFLYYINTMIMN